jgi:hypothetical protein
MVERDARRAVAIGLERPGRIDRNHAGAESGRDQGLQIGDAAALRDPRSAFLALLRDLGFTHGPAEHTGSRGSGLRDLALEIRIVHRAKNARLMGEILVDAL